MKTDIAPATKVSGKRVACLIRHWPAPPTSTAQAFFRQASLALESRPPHNELATRSSERRTTLYDALQALYIWKSVQWMAACCLQ